MRAPSPVYNVDISPQVESAAGQAEAPVLRSGTATTLRFGIGPRWASSVTPGLSPNAAILTATSDLRLTAVLACSFCDSHEAFMRDVVYRPSARESNVVSFTFTPRRPTAAEGTQFAGRLELSVFNDNTLQEYDRFVVPVSIAEEGTIPEVPTQAPLARPYAEPADAPLAADAVLRVVEDAGRQLQIEVIPLLPAVKTALEPLTFTADGLPRRFRTAPLNQRDLEKITTGAYARASAISLQGDLARRLDRGGPHPIVSPNALKTLMLSPAEAKNISTIIAETGQTLYRRLFVDGPDGGDLSRVIGMLEAAETDLGRPLRLHVVSDHLVLPWQYLHPVGPTIDPARFWGLRFDLSVQRVGNGAPERLGAAPSGTSRTVVFARHGSTSDQTVPLAMSQIAQLKSLPVPALKVVASGQELLTLLRSPSQDRAKVSAIVTFLHATSGKGLVTNDDPEGPLILFGDQDVVSADVLQSLPNSQSVEERRRERRYLGGAPLFILNACETGPSTIALPHSTFEEVAFELGAQGIVVTEVSVWVTLGHDVGTRLLRKLGAGQTVGHALTDVRRELLREKNNPLGVLYAYYGDPAATLRR